MLKRSDPQRGDATDPAYLIAYDDRRYTITTRGVCVASVAFDLRGEACVGEDLVLVLARQHAACLAAQGWTPFGLGRSPLRWVPGAGRRAGQDRVGTGFHPGTQGPDGDGFVPTRRPKVWEPAR